MKPLQILTVLVLPIMLFASAASNAAIVFPALDIQDISSTGDTGVSITATTLNIDATVFTIILDSVGNTNDIADQSFFLSAKGSSSTSPIPGFPALSISGNYDGSFNVGGGLLSGTFTNLSVSGLASQPTITGDVIYTGGILAGSLVGGRIELATAANSVVGKLGAVVPVPAAAWLFGSGLLGLAGIARRRKV